MGVPSYFSWIVKLAKKYSLPPMVYPKLTPGVKIKRLYFDFNCGIHQACKSDPNLSEEQMIHKTVEFVDQIVKLVNPTELIHIAIDGSVPMGKCKQQRYRRFKSWQETREVEQLCEKYGIEKDKSDHDFNMISPGTKFMGNLAQAIQEYINLNCPESSLGSNLLSVDA